MVEQKHSRQNDNNKICPYFQNGISKMNKAYLKGRCNHGNACKWIHPVPQKEQICPHFSVVFIRLKIRIHRNRENVFMEIIVNIGSYIHV